MTHKTPLKISSFLALFGFGIILPFSAQGVQIDKQKRGTVANTFLTVNSSVRAAALGGDQATLEGHFDSIFSNPAGLASLSVPEVWISHNQSFIDTQYNHIGMAMPMAKNSLGLSVNYIDQGKEERTEIDGTGQPITGLGEFRFSTLLAQMAWARKFGNKIYFGATAKGWSDKQDTTAETGWAVDTGLIFKQVFPLLDLGLATKNLGPAQSGYKLPTITTVGAALHLPIASERTSLYYEVDFPTFRESGSRVGLEFNQRYFRLRGGYESLTTNVGDSLGNFTFGMGLNVKGWRIDYAWLPKGDLGDQHQLALTVGFGLSPEERAQAAKELDIAMENRLKNRAQQYFLNGKQALTNGNIKLAAKEFENATVWDPHNVDARVELERVREELQFFEANGYYHQGVKYANQQQWLDATFYLKKAVKLVPSHVKATELLKKAERSIQKDNSASKRNITLADRQFNLGVKYYLEENYPAALREWKILLKKAPHQPDLREYIEKAEKMQAILQLEELKREKVAYSESIETLAKKAYSYYSLNQIDKAIEMWSRVVALDPQNQDALDALKKARERKNLANEDVADSKSRQIQELNSQAMNAYVNGDLNQAATIWKKALEISPNDLRLQNNLRRIESELLGRKAQR